MSSMIVKPPGDEHAYEQIEAAVMETSRGRWFLAEYARRHRHADTVSILGAIERLSETMAHSLAAPRAPAPAAISAAPLSYERLQTDIIEMARAIARAEREIRQIRHDGVTATQYVTASDELDAVVKTTEKATQQILGAAEKIQEYAWTLREHSVPDVDFDMIDSCTTEIYTACGFQDLTSQRIQKVVETLRFLDQRLKSILEATGLAEEFHADERMIEENGERVQVVRDSDIWMSEANQAEIDDTFDFFTPAEVVEPTMIGADLMELEAEILEPAPKAAAPAPAPAAPALPYDGLSTEEKLRAFR